MKCPLSKNNEGRLHLSHPHYHGCFPAYWPTVTNTVASSLTFSLPSSGASSGTLPRHGGMSCWEVWGTWGLKDSSSALAPYALGRPFLHFSPILAKTDKIRLASLYTAPIQIKDATHMHLHFQIRGHMLSYIRREKEMKRRWTVATPAPLLPTSSCLVNRQLKHYNGTDRLLCSALRLEP